MRETVIEGQRQRDWGFWVYHINAILFKYVNDGLFSKWPQCSELSRLLLYYLFYGIAHLWKSEFSQLFGWLCFNVFIMHCCHIPYITFVSWSKTLSFKHMLFAYVYRKFVNFENVIIAKEGKNLFFVLFILSFSFHSFLPKEIYKFCASRNDMFSLCSEKWIHRYQDPRYRMSNKTHARNRSRISVQLSFVLFHLFSIFSFSFLV